MTTETETKKAKKGLFVTIIGGGNSTAIFATLTKLAGHQVAILTRKPEKWSKTIGFDNEDEGYLDGGKYFGATMDMITADPAECIPQSDVIFIAGLPVHHNPAVLKQIAPHLNREKSVMVGTICAYGGFNWVAAECLGEGNYVLFGIQLIPWCCGTRTYGTKGVVFGAKRMLRIATEDGKDTHNVKALMQDILKTPDMRDTDFLASCLWPNNPSLHPPILYGIFKDWDGKAGYEPDSVPKKIYADLVDASAVALDDLDRDLNAIVDALKVHYPDNKSLQLNFHLRDCILENYLEQVTDPSTLKSTVVTCLAFGKHYIPYESCDDGKKIRPVLAHKFFETDLPYGLATWKDIANMMNLDTPMLDTIILWNQKLLDKEFMAPDGTMTGPHASECVLPSTIGLDLKTLDRGCRTKN
eukprot:scaffold53314_cov82-Attheya_sp.AAC.3